MDFPRSLVLMTLFFSSLLLQLSLPSLTSSSRDHSISSFHKCLINEFKRTNLPSSSTNSIIITPQNKSSYEYLLRQQNLRPGLISPVKPFLIVTPKNESEIQAVVRCSQKLGIQIRPRAGGHDYEGLSFTSKTPFVMLDLRNLNSVTIDLKSRTAWVQSGATLGQLYYAIARESKTLAFPGGVCPSVGVGGHISGGGYGMLSRKYGLASDNVADARLVGSNGEIYSDHRSMPEDLFWAVQGGGGANFGIVTAFKVKLVVVPKTVTVFTIVRPSEPKNDATTRLVRKWQRVAVAANESLMLRVTLRSTGNSIVNRTSVASFTALYLGRGRELSHAMRSEFPELGLTNADFEEMSWIESVLYFAGLRNQSIDVLRSRDPLGPFGPSYYKGKSDYAGARGISTNGLQGMWRFLHEEDENRGAVEFSPCGGVLSEDLRRTSPHWSECSFMIRYGATWHEGGFDEMKRHVEWIRSLYGCMGAYVRTKMPRAAYINYRDLDLGSNGRGRNTSYEEARVWGVKYFGDNFERLARAKARVDAENIFWNEQSIPPLLPM
ncbi:FAD-binding Berberine family protein [Striga hermonthica]|uniref:FAD-binding Berberine family protein n=1 Tax=Striga hermonthica TaxID=68872 RepID=A0A9N7NDV2_STRHE|nr:FAD-binding Berberine family protein [Striga hermonthica]